MTAGARRRAQHRCCVSLSDVQRPRLLQQHTQTGPAAARSLLTPISNTRLAGLGITVASRPGVPCQQVAPECCRRMLTPPADAACWIRHCLPMPGDKVSMDANAWHRAAAWHLVARETIFGSRTSRVAGSLSRRRVIAVSWHLHALMVLHAQSVDRTCTAPYLNQLHLPCT
jgi:hypothetical protein